MIDTLEYETNQKRNMIHHLRGFALIGMLFFIVQSFVYSPSQLAIDYGIGQRVMAMLTVGKFHFIFEFLFGVGAAMYMAKEARRSWKQYYLQALCLLLVGLGLQQLWNEDFLSVYAAVSLVLPFFYRRSITSTVIIGLIFSTLFDALSLIQTFTAQTWIAEQTTVHSVAAVTKIIGHMALGTAGYRLGFFNPNQRHRLLSRDLFLLTSIMTIMLWFISLFFNTDVLWQAVNEHFAIIPGYFYICLIYIVLDQASEQRWLTPFQAFGQLALTNYFLTIVGLFVAKHFNAFPAVVDPFHKTLVIYGGLVILLLFFSTIWMKLWKRGPIELIVLTITKDKYSLTTKSDS